MEQRTWVEWHKLESQIPLEELPAFHRAFLYQVRPDEADWDTVFLRKIQSKVQASLKQLERQGLAKMQEDKLWVASELIPESFQPYIGLC